MTTSPSYFSITYTNFQNAIFNNGPIEDSEQFYITCGIAQTAVIAVAAIISALLFGLGGLGFFTVIISTTLALAAHDTVKILENCKKISEASEQRGISSTVKNIVNRFEIGRENNEIFLKLSALKGTIIVGWVAQILHRLKRERLVEENDS